jgi:hypothetical protein
VHERATDNIVNYGGKWICFDGTAEPIMARMIVLFEVTHLDYFELSWRTGRKMKSRENRRSGCQSALDFPFLVTLCPPKIYWWLYNLWVCVCVWGGGGLQCRPSRSSFLSFIPQQPWLQPTSFQVAHHTLGRALWTTGQHYQSRQKYQSPSNKDACPIEEVECLFAQNYKLSSLLYTSLFWQSDFRC